jgi:6-pyruvoyltetrahydropterin/6-carboxytetrahydropterin synthase
MRTAITKIFSFDAAHTLPEHKGKCRQLHGHTYSLEVTIEGALQERGPATGMIMDFAELDQEVKKLVVEPLDHTHLNDHFDFAPTAEALAVWMLRTLQEAGLPVIRVRLWETPTSYAEIAT